MLAFTCEEADPGQVRIAEKANVDAMTSRMIRRIEWVFITTPPERGMVKNARHVVSRQAVSLAGRDRRAASPANERPVGFLSMS
jgi:hypothetical protein